MNKPPVSLEEYCKSNQVARNSGFYYSILSLTPDQRKALTALYVFCREVDDIVDECKEPSIAEIKLNFWHQEIDRIFLGIPQHPIGIALYEVCQKYPLQQEYFKEILNGMHMDLVNKRYATFEALSHYCYAVASCVGLHAIEIFGYSDEQTKIAAKHLGYALQLVNIIRDVGEDVRRGRIYIPEEDLEQYSVSAQDIIEGRYSDNFIALMQHQAKRARHFYQLALETFPAQDRYAQRSGLIMAEIYFTLLKEIEASKFQVLHQKISLTAIRKIWIALSTLWKIKRNKLK